MQANAVALAATSLVVACTAVVLVRSAPPAVGQALPLPDAPYDAPYRAYVVLQARDCASNMEFLRVLGRPKLRDSVAVTALVAGEASETQREDAARLLREAAGSGDLSDLSPRAAEALESLGFRATPFLVVIDRSGRVRFTAPAPDSFEALQNLDQLLTGLTHPVTKR